MRDGKFSKIVNWSKMLYVLWCQQCHAPPCVFSYHASGRPKGPQKKHICALNQLIEDNGYQCGDLVRIYSNGTTSPDPGIIRNDENGSDDNEDNEGGDKDGSKEEEEEPILFCKKRFSLWDGS